MKVKANLVMYLIGREVEEGRNLRSHVIGQKVGERWKLNVGWR